MTSKLFLNPVTFRNANDSASTTDLSSSVLFRGGIAVTKSLNVNGPLRVSSACTFDDTLNVNGSVTFTGSCSVASGTVAIDNSGVKLLTNGATLSGLPSSPTALNEAISLNYLNTRLSATSWPAITSIGSLTSLDVVGPTNLHNTLAVDENASFSANATFAGSIISTASASFQASATFNDKASFTAETSFSAATTFASQTTFNGSVNVASLSCVAGGNVSLNKGAVLSFSDGDDDTFHITVTNDDLLVINNNNNNNHVMSIAKSDGTITLAGAKTLNAGSLEIQGTLAVDSAATFGAGIIISTKDISFDSAGSAVTMPSTAISSLVPKPGDASRSSGEAVVLASTRSASAIDHALGIATDSISGVHSSWLSSATDDMTSAIDLIFGGTIRLHVLGGDSGGLHLQFPLDSSSSKSGALVVDGGAAFGGSLTLTNGHNIGWESSSSSSTSSSTSSRTPILSVENVNANTATTILRAASATGGIIIGPAQSDGTSFNIDIGNISNNAQGQVCLHAGPTSSMTISTTAGTNIQGGLSVDTVTTSSSLSCRNGNIVVAPTEDDGQACVSFYRHANASAAPSVASDLWKLGTRGGMFFIDDNNNNDNDDALTLDSQSCCLSLPLHLTSTILVDGMATYAGSARFTGPVYCDATTDATSTTTGAVVAVGGLATASGVYAGSDSVFTKSVQINGNKNATTPQTGALVVSNGGVGIAGDVVIGGSLTFSAGASAASGATLQAAAAAKNTVRPVFTLPPSPPSLSGQLLCVDESGNMGYASGMQTSIAEFQPANPSVLVTSPGQPVTGLQFTTPFNIDVTVTTTSMTKAATEVFSVRGFPDAGANGAFYGSVTRWVSSSSSSSTGVDLAVRSDGQVTYVSSDNEWTSMKMSWVQSPTTFASAGTYGSMRITDITNSVSTTSGALSVSGGMGLARDLCIGGSLSLFGGINLSIMTVDVDSNTLTIDPSQACMFVLHPVSNDISSVTLTFSQIRDGAMVFISASRLISNLVVVQGTTISTSIGPDIPALRLVFISSMCYLI